MYVHLYSIFQGKIKFIITVSGRWQWVHWTPTRIWVNCLVGRRRQRRGAPATDCSGVLGHWAIDCAELSFILHIIPTFQSLIWFILDSVEWCISWVLYTPICPTPLVTNPYILLQYTTVTSIRKCWEGNLWSSNIKMSNVFDKSWAPAVSVTVFVDPWDSFNFHV